MANRWFRDPRMDEAEVLVFEAERAFAREEDPSWSTLREIEKIWRQAADRYWAVAQEVPATLPRTRWDIALSALFSYRHAGDTATCQQIRSWMTNLPGVRPHMAILLNSITFSH